MQVTTPHGNQTVLVNVAARYIPCIQIWLIGDLEAKEVVTEDRFAHFSDPETKVGRVIEGNTCGRGSITPIIRNVRRPTKVPLRVDKC